MKGVIINGYYNEKRFETKKSEWAYLFNTKVSKQPRGLIIK